MTVLKMSASQVAPAPEPLIAAEEPAQTEKKA
jgi:hypothetical protein